MHSTIFAALFAAMATQAQAAEIMDGYDAGLGKGIADKIAGSLVTKTNDPYSAQIISLHRGIQGQICALVNLRNLTGGYTGFQPYFLSLTDKTGQLGEHLECMLGKDEPDIRKDGDLCNTAADQYISSGGAKSESETRSCLSEKNHGLFALGILNRIKEARLPLAKEFE